MKQDEVIFAVQKVGRNSLNRYETEGGLIDIACGIYIIASSYIIVIHKLWYWMFIWWALGLFLFLMINIFRKMILVPRIGYAQFTNQIKGSRTNLAGYFGILLIVPYFMILQAIYPDFLANGTIVYCLNLSLIGSNLTTKVWYYFLGAFILVGLFYAPYVSQVSNLWLMSLLLVVIFFAGQLARKIPKAKQYWELPKPRNFKQHLFMAGIALSFQFILYSLFRYDVTNVLKTWILKYPSPTVGITVAAVLAVIGSYYKVNRMILYSILILVLSVVSRYMFRFHINPGVLVYFGGLAVLISGIWILRKFLKENPVIAEDNFLEDKVLDDTK